MPAKTTNKEVLPRQIALAAAFLLPTGKLLELPSLLARYAAGDILLPALLHFLTQTLLLLAIISVAVSSKYTLCERLERTLGKFTFPLYLLFAAYYLFAAALPLLDLEKFVYAAFYDTAPTTFSFALFFLFAAFVCAKGLKTLGRFADFCVWLFPLPFLALILLSSTAADYTRLLPLFGSDVNAVAQGFYRSTPHFSDVALLLPLIANCRFRKNDGIKVVCGYGAGAVLTCLFLAAFYAVYGSIAPREHYAFVKIAQYFPALAVLGRVDLLLSYIVSIVLFVYTATPLSYACECLARNVPTARKTLLSALLLFVLFFLVLYLNKYYNAFYEIISGKLPPLFFLFADFLPLLALFLGVRKEGSNAD